MGTTRIVVIDDEKDVVTYLTSALQDNGFEVYSAGNANDGLELVRSKRPDLLCLDILMPEETGFSLYRKIKEDQSLKGIPVVIISGLNMEREMAQIGAGDKGGFGIRMEPDGYIEKPIDLSLFIKTVQKLVA